MMSLEDVFKQFNNMIQQVMQLMMITLAVALIVAIIGVRKEVGKAGVARPKTAAEAVKEVLEHEGYVLVTVDEDKCGYCGAAKIMLDARGIPYKEVNISDLPEEDIEEFVKQTGVEWVPALLHVRDGRIVMRKMFEGKKEKDIPWVRQIAV